MLFGGTDPGGFVPTYMIFCESRVGPKDRYRDPHLDPEGGPKFDRRDVYIITQNALADNTYMSYIRDHYDYSRPGSRNPQTLERPVAVAARAVPLGLACIFIATRCIPKEPIWIPSEQDTQQAFQEYVNDVQARQAHGEKLTRRRAGHESRAARPGARRGRRHADQRHPHQVDFRPRPRTSTRSTSRKATSSRGCIRISRRSASS